jgi:cell division protein ZapA (FtsZ GTPase activity inhibitor)
MKNEDDIVIQVQIFNRNYKITAPQDQENAIRKSVSEFNSNFEMMRKDFPNRDIQDYMSMALIALTTSFHNSVKTVSDESEFIVTLEKIKKIAAE